MKHLTIQQIQRLDLIESALADAKTKMKPDSRLITDLEWLTSELRKAWQLLEKLTT